MDKNRFQVGMIERLGAPLLAAIAVTQGENSPPAAATMAQALNRAVQLGIGLADGVDLRGDAGQADAARLSLTSVAARVVAEFLRKLGRLPNDAELRALLPAAQAVLVFADAFAPGGGAEPQHGEVQDVIRYLEAMTPAIAEINRFSFGRQDRKLAQDVAERLAARAHAMAASLFPNGADKRDETALLAALGRIYAACHQAEAARLAGLDEPARAQMTDAGGLVSLDTLWSNVEAQAAMLEALGAAFSGAGETAAGNARPASPEAPVETLPPIAAPVQAAPLPKPANPMGFFKPGARPAPPENGDGV